MSPINNPTPPPASQVQEENQRLKRAVEELSVLNDLARAIGGSLSTQEIIQTITRRSLRAVSAEQGVITLVVPETTGAMTTLVRTVLTSSEHENFHLHQSILGWMHLNKKPLLINDPPTDERFKGVKWDATVRNLLCVPLMTKSELKGVITVYNKKGDARFTEEDQRLLVIIAGQSAQVIENARLYEQEKSLLLMQEQLRLAHDIQMGLLPKNLPSLPGYDIAARSIPAQMVGGDLFDFIKIDENRMAIALGDVTGKGMPASLLMANVQATLRGQTLLASSAKECIIRSNKLLLVSTSDEKFVTLFYGILNTTNHRLLYCNAGHDHPFLISETREQRRLGQGGVVLGILEEFPFTEEEVQLEPGDTLVIYSDGISEAMNIEREMWGERKLEELLRERQGEPAERIIDHVVAAVKTHAGACPQSDDLTIVVVKRLKV